MRNNYTFREDPFEFYPELEHDLLDGEFDFEFERSPYPGISCFTPGNPYVLHCFPPFKTELTKKQHAHLDIIARKIQRSFASSRPIIKVMIIGHSSTWHRTSRSALEYRSLQRAGNARNQLLLRLNPMGLAKKVDIKTNGRSDTVPWKGKRYSSTSGSQKAQNDRALNRRVEIFLTRVTVKKCVHEDRKLADRLQKMPTAGLHQERIVRKRISCLRDMVVDALRCNSAIDDIYVYSPYAIKAGPPMKIDIDDIFNKRHLIDDLKENIRVRCKGKRGTGTALAKCFKEVFDDVDRSIRLAFSELYKFHQITKMKPSSLSKTPYCKYPCYLMRKTRKSNSIYKCYSEYITSSFSKLCTKCK